jgi:predicted esterase
MVNRKLMVRGPLATAALLMLLAGCGSDEVSRSTDRGGSNGGSTSDTGTSSDASDDAQITIDTGSTGDTEADTGTSDTGTTDTAVADTGTSDTGGGTFEYGDPDPVPAYSGGACPTFASGSNNITTGGDPRDFLLFLPANPVGAPVIFLWHGLGDSAANFASGMGASQIAQQYGAIVIVPSMAPGGGMLGPIWSFPSSLGGAPAEQDLTLFDDILGCADGQYDIDNRRVYSAGFSAGAIWTTYLTMNRAGLLASTAIFSGGVNAQLTFPYASSDYPMPVIMSHGGSTDSFNGILQFMPMMMTLSEGLATDGHFGVLCTHTQGHTVTNEIVLAAYDFLFRNEWGTGTSPLATDGIPASYPSTCAVVQAP